MVSVRGSFGRREGRMVAVAETPATATPATTGLAPVLLRLATVHLDAQLPAAASQDVGPGQTIQRFVRHFFVEAADDVGAPPSTASG